MKIFDKLPPFGRSLQNWGAYKWLFVDYACWFFSGIAIGILIGAMI